jgi:hypothetical protein
MNIYILLDQDNIDNLQVFKTKNEVSHELSIHRNTLNISKNEYKDIKGYRVYKRHI